MTIAEWAPLAGWAAAVGTWVTHGVKWLAGRKRTQLSDTEIARRHARDALEATEEARRYQKERDEVAAVAKAEKEQLAAAALEQARQMSELQGQLAVERSGVLEMRALARQAVELAERAQNALVVRDHELSIFDLETRIASALVNELITRGNGAAHDFAAASAFPAWPLMQTALSRRQRLTSYIGIHGLPVDPADVWRRLTDQDSALFDAVPRDLPGYSPLGDASLENYRQRGAYQLPFTVA